VAREQVGPPTLRQPVAVHEALRDIVEVPCTQAAEDRLYRLRGGFSSFRKRP
jgi:hypothetical protein